MISEEQKLECVKYAKQFAIGIQNYEAASSIRDIEKSLINKLGRNYPDRILVDGAYVSNIKIQLEDLNIEQLYFLAKLFRDSFGNKHIDFVSEIIEHRRERAIGDILE